MRCLVTGASGFIGTNFVECMQQARQELLNLDIAAPQNENGNASWRQCDILDRSGLRAAIQEFQPTHVVHLAARTDTDGKSVEEYRVNTEGTANLLEAVQESGSVLRFVHTSTQFVLRPGRLPQHDEDFSPHTVYGESKVMAEGLVRKANLPCVWTIIRPTNIWGPWHPRYPHEFWRVLSKGLYVHPVGKPVIRCYGYVKNVVFQIRRILEAPPEQVDRKVFYVGDRPIELLDWVNGFARALTGRNARTVPKAMLQSVALFGDACSLIGVKFPIYSSRLRSMTEDYLTPMEPTLAAFGDPPYTLEEGIRETAEWLKSRGYVKRLYLAPAGTSG